MLKKINQFILPLFIFLLCTSCATAPATSSSSFPVSSLPISSESSKESSSSSSLNISDSSNENSSSLLSSTDSEFERYNFEDFSVKYPSSATVDESSLFTLFTTKNYSIGVAELTYPSEVEALNDTNALDYFNTLVNQYQSGDITGGKLISDPEQILLGNEVVAYRAQLEGKHQQAGNIKIDVVFTLIGQKSYTFMFMSSVNSYRIYVQSFDEMIDSFELL